MSDEEPAMQGPSATYSLLATEYRDGQLQIVEVAQCGKEEEELGTSTSETHILPDLNSEGMEQPRHVQVLNADKSVVQLDLLNMTLVRCEDGADTTYKLVANTEAPAGTEIPSDATLTCVLQSSDQEDGTDQDNQDTYVVMDGEQGPLVFLQSDFAGGNVQVVKQDVEDKNKLTPVEILAKAKALQKRAQTLQNSKIEILKSNKSTKGAKGRKLKSEFPAPHELLASPNFKLFLYSCKMCHFKCNAVKDMTAHKAEEHSSGARVRAGRAGAPLQCARCPYKANSHSQLMRHVQDRHISTKDDHIDIVNLNSKEVDEAHVLVCGACGFECNTKMAFKRHIKDEHGATAVTI